MAGRNPRAGAPVLRLVSVSGRNVAGGLPDPLPARVLCLLRSLLGRHVFPDRSLGAWRRWPVGPKILRLHAGRLAGDPARHPRPGDRKSVVKGKSVSVRVALGGRSIIKKKNLTYRSRLCSQKIRNKIEK